MPVELYALVGLIALPVLWLLYVGTNAQRIGVLAFCVLGGVCLSLWWINTEPLPGDLVETGVPPVGAIRQLASMPAFNKESGYVSSAACVECHDEQHETWHDTYHRTMTQVASPEAVVPDWDNITLSSRGRDYHLYRVADEFWVDTVDPAAEAVAFLNDEADIDSAADIERSQRQIVMTTGSHFHQTYWMQNPNGMLMQFPWVYHIDAKRWVYRIDSFLRPPGDTVTFNFWNVSCIRCHSTGGVPNVDDATKTMHSIGELGIACEACHGPGKNHIEWARNNSSDRTAMMITNPHKLSAERSARVCGQCHVLANISDRPRWMANGMVYRPGHDEDFEAVQEVIEQAEDVEFTDPHFESQLLTQFWPDGTSRTGGREYNGLIRSACYLEGTGDRQLHCLSCHSMHSYRSNNKLMAEGLSGNQMCTQCHTDPTYTIELAQHTHHATDSVGSQCINCHMSNTSYALFTAIRSHRIQAPAVRGSTQGARPNACNLCHLDQSKQWAADRLANWFDIPQPDLTEDEKDLAAGVLWALKGDAAQRAIAAWHLGWDAAQEALKLDGWQTRILAEMLLDRYPAVRYVAYEALQQFPEFADLDFDFDASLSNREQVHRRVSEAQPTVRFADSERAAKVIVNEDGSPIQSVLQRLLDEQDQTPIAIVE